MSETASESHVDEYRARGYAVVRGVFDANDVAALAAAFDREYAVGMAHGRSFRHGKIGRAHV